MARRAGERSPHRQQPAACRASAVLEMLAEVRRGKPPVIGSHPLSIVGVMPDPSCTRGQVLALGTALLAGAPAIAKRLPQRAVIIMCDGFGVEYLEQSPMPALARWRQSGLFRRVQGMMPSVTNTNNASICCGVWPDRHGITGNSYFNQRTGREEYMETADLLLAPTLFQRAAKQGVKSALLSSKKKTTTLLAAGADLRLTAEAPPRSGSTGSAPRRHYSREINYWLLTAAIDLLKTDAISDACTSTPPTIRCTPASRCTGIKQHLARLDHLFERPRRPHPTPRFC